MRRYLKILATGIFLALPWIGAASAQQVNPYCTQSTAPPYVWAPCNPNNALAVTASVSASISGFPTIQSTGTPLAVTSVSATAALPTGAVVVASNVGATNGAYCKLGASATTSDQLIPPNSWFAFTVGANTQLSCITSTSTTTVNLVGGSGLPTGSGGGGGGAGGSSSITSWGGGTLGAMANYGTSPGAVLVPGMNAFITNVPTVAQATAANFNATVVGTGTFATQVSAFTSWAGGTLGAMANYGTSPGAVLVPGVNASVTNTVTVNGSGVTQPVSVASGQIVDGGDTTQGAKADAACAGGGSACSLNARLAHLENITAGAIPAGTNSIGSVNLAANVTATDCSGTVTTGGTAVNAFTAQTTLHGFTILNDDTTEPLWISFTTTAAASTAGSYPLAPATATSFAGASSFTSPPGFGTNHALSVIAATTAHKYSCTWW
jgi:hypothetical protein